MSARAKLHRTAKTPERVLEAVRKAASFGASFPLPAGAESIEQPRKAEPIFLGMRSADLPAFDAVKVESLGPEVTAT